ncbi:hypothetical protein [Pinirhizobacter soli]|uniref:hypothetical protein n=1 Tax=Pinirhizobacter soli TaxID=2786953 RepID=UPI00202A2A76|nr:hypothetical protein [Pinirhizobacter soli]
MSLTSLVYADRSSPGFHTAIACRIGITAQLKTIGPVSANGPVSRWQRDHDVASVHPRKIAALTAKLGDPSCRDALGMMANAEAFHAGELPPRPENEYEKDDAVRFVRMAVAWERRYAGTGGAVIGAVLRDAADEARRAATPASLSLRRLAVTAVVDRCADVISASDDPQRQRVVLDALTREVAPLWAEFVLVGRLNALPAAMRPLMQLVDPPSGREARQPRAT